MVLVVAFFTAGLTDLLLNRWKTKRWIFPQSGLITGSGLSLLMESPELKLYALAAFAAILSKHHFKYNGRHVFNPATYGLLFVTSLFPYSAVSFGGQWGAMWWMTCIVLSLGCFVAYRAKVLDVAIFWILSFFAVAIFRHFLTGISIHAALGPASGAGFALFAFYMITDPRTIPEERSSRAAFCFIAACLDGWFRYQQNHYSMFWGIFVTYILFVLTQELKHQFSRLNQRLENA
jgi:Na+-transporting NADH:ubiquinone oxidoreductase subunit NqrB